MRSGISLPVEGEIFGHVLETGWEVEGGGRSLFFNVETDRAWAIDLSLSNIFNRGQRSDIKVPYLVLLPTGTNPTTGLPTGFQQIGVPVSVRELNRTFANISVGREWYLWGNASNCNESRWRVGIDAGGSLGTAKIEFHELAHHTDTIGRMFVALSTDWECPCGGCCTFLAGVRLVWDYTWMDILQRQNDSDLEDLNIVFSFGVRF
jgi:hypothetical protein